LLGFSIVCMTAQDETSQEEFERVMPTSPLKIQGLSLLVKNMMRADTKKRSAGAKEAWKKVG